MFFVENLKRFFLQSLSNRLSMYWRFHISINISIGPFSTLCDPLQDQSEPAGVSSNWLLAKVRTVDWSPVPSQDPYDLSLTFPASLCGNWIRSLGMEVMRGQPLHNGLENRNPCAPLLFFQNKLLTGNIKIKYNISPPQMLISVASDLRSWPIVDFSAVKGLKSEMISIACLK